MHERNVFLVRSNVVIRLLPGRFRTFISRLIMHAINQVAGLGADCRHVPTPCIGTSVRLRRHRIDQSAVSQSADGADAYMQTLRLPRLPFKRTQRKRLRCVRLNGNRALARLKLIKSMARRAFLNILPDLWALSPNPKAGTGDLNSG